MSDFLQGWYSLSLPFSSVTTRGSTPQAREQQRYAQLTSGFLLLFIVFYIPGDLLLFFDAPTSSVQPMIALISGAILFISFFLGKLGLQRSAAIGLLVLILVTVTGDLATNPLDPSIFPTTYALLFAVVMAGAALPPIAALIVGLVNCIDIILLVLLVPHTAMWTTMWQRGLYSIFIFLPICLQCGIAIICFVIMRNLITALRRADRAEEIVALQEAIATHEENRSSQQLQLEEALKRIAEVHARIANGDLSARVSLTEGDVLWAVAVPLNHLLNRLQAAKHAQDALMNLQQTAQSIAEQLHTNIQMHQTRMLPVTGTILDPIILEINQFAQNYQSSQYAQNPASPQPLQSSRVASSPIPPRIHRSQDTSSSHDHQRPSSQL